MSSTPQHPEQADDEGEVTPHADEIAPVTTTPPEEEEAEKLGDFA